MSRKSRSRHAGKRTIQLEKLEKREVFAGNVIAAVNPVTNTIQLTGDNANNLVEVRSNFAGGTVILGLAGTLINGGAGFIAPLATPNLQSTLNGGNDHLFIHDLAMASLDVNDAAGDNSMMVRNVRVSNDVAVKTNAGADIIDFHGQVQGDVKISTGLGNDIVKFEGKVGVFLSAHGAPPVTPLLDISTGDGNDFVSITNSHVLPSAFVSVNTGAGNDRLNTLNSLIEGALLVRMETGDDQALIETTDSAFADFGMGDGNDVLELDIPSLVGTVYVFDGGNGFDILNRNGLLFHGAPSNFEVLI